MAPVLNRTPDQRMVCWPTKWLEAAVKAGLAKTVGDSHYIIVGGDEMRDKLQIFASAILELED